MFHEHNGKINCSKCETTIREKKTNRVQAFDKFEAAICRKFSGGLFFKISDSFCSLLLSVCNLKKN